MELEKEGRKEGRKEEEVTQKESEKTTKERERERLLRLGVVGSGRKAEEFLVKVSRRFAARRGGSVSH